MARILPFGRGTRQRSTHVSIGGANPYVLYSFLLFHAHILCFTIAIINSLDGEAVNSDSALFSNGKVKWLKFRIDRK